MEDRLKMLVATIHKLYIRGAKPNIRKILAKTHPSDIAAVLHSLSPEERFEIFLMEPSFQRRAQILSYLDASEQKELVSLLGKEDVLKLISLMDRDDAADLLGHLPEEESKEYLSAMVRKDSEEVANLLGYAEDSAGGLMSPDFLGLNQNLSVAQAVAVIQTEGEEGKVTFYLYVVNDHNQLVGVVSLKQLLLSRRETLLREIMHKEVVAVHVNIHQEEVAQLVERYDFLALPVIDGNNTLVGVITVDDVIDVIREEAEEDLLAMGRAGWEVDVPTFEHFKARLPWVLLSFLGGAVCFAVIYIFSAWRQPTPDPHSMWFVVGFLPVLLSLGATTGSQAATVVVGALRAHAHDPRRVIAHLRKEMSLALMFAGLFGVAVGLAGAILFPGSEVNWQFGIAMAVQLILAIALGSLIPLVLERAGFDPTVASVPLFTTVADISAVAVLLVVYHNL